MTIRSGIPASTRLVYLMDDHVIRDALHRLLDQMSMEEPMRVAFYKSGAEIKTALQRRRVQLQQRLERRNHTLDAFLADTPKVRSYLIRSAEPTYGHGNRASTLYAANDISSEEKEEIAQLCQRIYELEQELHRLAFVETHLADDKIFELSLEELVGYGFDMNDPSVSNPS